MKAIIIFLLSFEAIFSLVGFGYWVNPEDMSKVDLKDLSSKGTTDLFLKSTAFERLDEKKISAWIKEAKEDYNIRVHIWMKCFYRDDKWVNPAKDDTEFIIKEAEKYAKMSNVAGVSLDYIRYHSNNPAYKNEGGTDAISEFVKTIEKRVHAANSKCILSASIVAATTSSIKYYGQDYSVFSKYLNIVLPMVYRETTHDSDWIQTTSEWYVTNSRGADVWVGLQSYVSEDDHTPLSSSVLTKDIKAALKSKCDGVILFRYGISYYPRFTDL